MMKNIEPFGTFADTPKITRRVYVLYILEYLPSLPLTMQATHRWVMTSIPLNQERSSLLVSNLHLHSHRRYLHISVNSKSNV